jgi:hypothetical protein
VILYLHIGTEKTGTTSIQRFFAGNRPLLAQNGIFYPRVPGPANHLALATYAHTRRGGELWRKMEIKNLQGYQNFRAALQRDLGEELAAAPGPIQKTIMSNEHCSSRLKTVEEIEDLRQFLSGFFDDIYILVYLRRQDDFLVSTYSTAIKNGNSGVLAQPTDVQIARRYDYWELLSHWAQVFGRDRIICRKFEKDSLIDGDVVTDALATMGVDADERYERTPDANISLDAACLEFLRLMNKHMGADWKMRRTIVALEGMSKGPLIDLPPAERRELMARVRDSNARVAREYFGGELQDSDDPLFRPRSDRRPRTSEVVLDGETAVAMAAALMATTRPPDNTSKKAKRRAARAAKSPADAGLAPTPAASSV